MGAQIKAPGARKKPQKKRQGKRDCKVCDGQGSLVCDCGKKPLRVWISDDFMGYNPVGTAAVVVAATRTEARKLLDAKQPYPGEPFTLSLLDLSKPRAHVINDGDY